MQYCVPLAFGPSQVSLSATQRLRPVYSPPPACSRAPASDWAAWRIPSTGLPYIAWAGVEPFIITLSPFYYLKVPTPRKGGGMRWGTSKLFLLLYSTVFLLLLFGRFLLLVPSTRHHLAVRHLVSTLLHFILLLVVEMRGRGLHPPAPTSTQTQAVFAVSLPCFARLRHVRLP